MVAKGEEWSEKDELGVWGRCKLHLEWINNKVLLCSSGNYIQYPGINHNEKNTKKKVYMCLGFPGGTHGKEAACQCRRCKRCGFYPWVWKIPWSRKGQATQVFLPGKSHGQRNLAGYSVWGGKRARHNWVTKHTHTRACVTESLCLTAEICTTLWINHISIKKIIV